MAFLCCGKNYKKSDLETYWCIETYKMKPVQKKYVGDNRIYAETVETCICKNCGCLHLHVKRFGRKNGKRKLIEIEEMKGTQADFYLLEKQKYLIQQEKKCPIPVIASATSLPFVYGCAIAPNKQRAKYDAALPQKDSWRNKYENGKWMPDIFQSECKVIKNA